MNDPHRPLRRVAPDARIIRPEQQPQRYDYDARRASAPARARPVSRSQPTGVNWAREVLETFLPALLLAIFIHIFLAQATQVVGYSMEPTLSGRQRLIIEKVSYRFHPPKRGDIVVLSDPRYGPEPLIKRVIGLPGDVIAIEHGRVLINGEPYDEPYLNGVIRADFPATVVPEDHVFVMGDNRNNSNDSRAFGPVPISDIIGRAWVRYWPLSAWRLFP